MGMPSNYYSIMIAGVGGLPEGDHYKNIAFKSWKQGDVWVYVYGESSEYEWDPENPNDVHRDIVLTDPSPEKQDD